MKSVNIFLSTVAAFGLIGGALAFKANEICYLYVHDANDARISACTKMLFAATLTINAIPPIQTTRASVASTTAGCPIVTIYKCE